MYLLNALGLAQAMAAMREHGALGGTGATTTANLVFSVRAPRRATPQALVGALAFGERLPPLWWFGAACLFAGVTLLARPKPHAHQE